VTAWTGVAATGKKLETLELDWTTGDLLLNFEKTDFMFKGVAKSISFTVPKFNGIKFSRAFWVDNVAICRHREGAQGDAGARGLNTSGSF
jgi:hypothetical protein